MRLDPPVVDVELPTVENSAELPLAEVLRLYRGSLPAGTFTEEDLTPLDRTGVPTTAATWSAPVRPGRDGSDPSGAGGTGYGATPVAAQVGALGELFEGIFPESAALRCETVTASYDQLISTDGSAAVCDPLTLTLSAALPYSPAQLLLWGRAQRWRTGEEVWVPLEFLASEATTLERRFKSREWLITPVTNGLGAGIDLDQAVCHGLLEILQRDGDTVSFRALDQGLGLDISGIDDPVVVATVAALRAAGIEPLVKVAADEFVPVVYCVGDGPAEDEPEPVALSAIGEAAHPDPVVAVRKALLEFAASRARRIFSFGSIANLRRHLPEYAATLSERVGEPGEARAFEEMKRWCAMDGVELRSVLTPIFRHERDIKLNSFATAVSGIARSDLLDHVLAVLGDFNVLVMEGSPSGAIRTAKVIVPGLEVETLSYLRIGERVARRLLDRGSDLVVKGQPTKASQLLVHLTDAATERLGGPVSIDRDRFAAVVDRLYPLYREPNRHVAPLALESS